jgi:NAD(P)-dependent dehydrogenase (short-subunit alcohol dehydrogenase family)
MTGKRPLHARTPYASSKTALTGLGAHAGLGGRRGRHPGQPHLPRARGRRTAGGRDRAAGHGQGHHGAGEPPAVHLRLAARRFVAGDDVAAAVLFLASAEAASITGEDLNVSAGSVTYS